MLIGQKIFFIEKASYSITNRRSYALNLLNLINLGKYLQVIALKRTAILTVALSFEQLSFPCYDM